MLMLIQLSQKSKLKHTSSQMHNLMQHKMQRCDFIAKAKYYFRDKGKTPILIEYYGIDIKDTTCK